jgi:S1-C subfamily serine protease
MAGIDRKLFPLIAAALIALGALGHAALLTVQAPTVPAGPTVAAAAVQAPAAQVKVTAADLDAITQRAFAVASPSVVYVNNVGVGSGSGVIYDATGNIVTNAHVVQGAQTLRVTLATGQTLDARIVGIDAVDDLAVIAVKATRLPAARFAPAGTYRVAQTVLAIGSPLGFKQSVTGGLISALDRTVGEPSGAYLPDAIQTSAPINPGNSGGALVTLDGVVVGIPTLQAGSTGNGTVAQDIGFAVPSPRVTAIARQLIATGKVAHTGRAYLGVATSDASARSSPYGEPTAAVEGALVRTVAPQSPADQAGVQPGDIITALGNTPIAGSDELLAALARQKPGTTVTLTLARSGQPLTVRVQLGELSAAP